MKSKHITPNTPFFKRFGNKIIIPAGVEEGGGMVEIEYMPSEFTQELMGMPNPMLLTTQVGGILISKNAIESFVCTVDGVEIEGVAGVGVITQEMVDMYPDGESRDYMAARIGWYVGECIAQNPETLTEGTTHDVTTTVNGVEIFNSELTVVDNNQ